MRMVLDTSVLVAALRSQLGASRALLNAALASRFELLVSNALVLEYEAVMTRPDHLAAARSRAAEVGELLDAICAAATPVAIARLIRPALPDPDDEMVLEAAVNGRAAAIVTFNCADFAGVPEGFGIEILSPRKALKRIEIR